MPFTIQTETLLAHEPFIRSVARAVLHDEAAAQDVVQETWMRALQPVARPVEDARAWLGTVARNIALGHRRASGRRAVREQAAAQPERVEASTASEALELQGAVIRAVLALSEPYRTVVLQRHFEERTFPEIAHATGVTESTVRSRVSRAHALLRDALGDRCDRRAWMLLAGWPGLPAAPAKGTAVSAKLVGIASASLVVGTTLVLAVGGRGGLGPRAPSKEPGLAQVGAAKAETDTELVQSPVREEVGRSAEVEAAKLAPVPARAGAPASRPNGPALRLGSGAELRAEMERRLERVVWIGRAIRDRLLTPGPTTAHHHEALLARDHTGVCRLVDRRIVRERGLEHTIFVRGGGAYYSFETEEHSYDSEPDLELSEWLGSGFYGGAWGLVVPLGQASIADLEASADAIPAQLDDLGRAAWEIAWGEHDTRPDMSIAMITAARYRLPAAGEAYLVRSSSEDEHDHLVAVECSSVDEYGCTLVWRRLAAWDVPKQRQRRPSTEDDADVPPADAAFLAEVASKSLEQLFDLMDAERARARRDFLLLDGAATDEAEPAGAADEHGLVRLLHASRFDPLFGAAGTGSYFSFETLHHGAEGNLHPPQVELRLGRLLSTVGEIERGLFLPLGKITRESFEEASRARYPNQPVGEGAAGGAAADARRRELWALLCDASPSRSSIRKASSSDVRPGLQTAAAMYREHSFLFRAKPFGDGEPPILIRVLASDQHGVSLAWRQLGLR